MDTTRRKNQTPSGRARSVITVALEPREIRALLIAAHMTMDVAPADDEALLESAAAILREALDGARQHTGPQNRIPQADVS